MNKGFYGSNNNLSNNDFNYVQQNNAPKDNKHKVKLVVLVVILAIGLLVVGIGVGINLGSNTFNINSIFSGNEKQKSLSAPLKDDKDVYIVSKIVDKTEVCAQALEKFYEDDKYAYYFSCKKSSTLIVHYTNGKKESFANALKKNRVSVATLDKFSIAYTKEAKNVSTNIWKIVDETESCAQAIEDFYEDNDYIYSFSCIKSGTIIVYYNDGSKESVKTAINNNRVTIYDLTRFGIAFSSRLKNDSYVVSKIFDETETCASAIEKFYEDDTYTYTFPCQKSGSVIVYYTNGKSENVKEALNNKHISIEDLTSYGIEFTKTTKKTGYTVTKIVDNTKTCAQAIEEFYEDSKYVYTFSCYKSSTVIVHYANGKTENVKVALNNKHITIDDLTKYGIKFNKSAKKTGYTVTKIVDNSGTCAQALEKFYEDSTYYYYFSCQKSSSVIVHYANGKTENIKNALKNNRVKVTDLTTYGIKYTKEKKSNVYEISNIVKEDDGMSYAQSLTKFYEDNTYNYYYKDASITAYRVYYKNGKKEDITTALENKHITLDDLSTYGIKYTKKSKADTYIVEKIVDNYKTGDMCLQAIDEYYLDGELAYRFNCVRHTMVIVYYTNGKTENIKEALDNRRITIADLRKYGIGGYTSVNKDKNG